MDSFIEFCHAFGYNCKKPENLCILGENTLIWAAGSMITFYHLDENQFNFKSSSTRGSIGSIKKHPNENILAVAEGYFFNTEPLIVMYKWPEWEIISTLKHGTKYAFSSLDFNKNGTLLTSVGDAPDYFLTIWDLENNCIKLQAKAFHDSIYQVRFSSYNDEQLVTCGREHIKFWRMINTFTGLKLFDTHGCFGMSNTSDIRGILILPDGKVLSGCDWGNILLWQFRFIKLEITRKGKKPCHEGPIVQFVRDELTNDITTIGMDGKVCTWHWEEEDEILASDNVGILELNPLFEKNYQPSKFVSIVQHMKSSWFAQDTSCGIITIELSHDSEVSIGKKRKVTPTLINAHGCALSGLAELENKIISLGYDGSFLLHETPKGATKYLTSFSMSATNLLCMPRNLNKEKKMIIIGFENGMIQTIEFTSPSFEEYCCVQTLKPHTKSVTAMLLQEKQNKIITCSDDSAIFIYNISIVKNQFILSPLYYIMAPNAISSVICKSDDFNTILLVGNQGFILEGYLPITDMLPDPDNINTFQKEFENSQLGFIKSYSLYSNMLIAEFDQNSDKNELDDLTFINDTSQFQLVCENIESTPNIIVLSKYDPDNYEHIWISQKNCNCLMRYKIGASNINAYIPFEGPTQGTITSLIHVDNRLYAAGTSYGFIYFFILPKDIEINSETIPDLKQQERILQLKTRKKKLVIIEASNCKVEIIKKISVHDNLTGIITHITLSVDKRYLFTAGEDGNIFVFKMNHEIKDDNKKFEILESSMDINEKNIKAWEMDENKILSHEQYLREKERISNEHDAAQHADAIIQTFSHIKDELTALFIDNNLLPDHMQVKFYEEFRVRLDIQSEINKKLDRVRRRLAFQLEVSNLGLKKMMNRNIDDLDIFPFKLISLINPDSFTRIIRQKKLPSNYHSNMNKVQSMLMMEKQKENQKTTEVVIIEETVFEEVEKEILCTAPLLHDFPTNIKTPRPLEKAIQHYIIRNENSRIQDKKWKDFLHSSEHEKSKEETFIEATKDEYSLKSNLEFLTPTSSKYETLYEMFQTRNEIFDINNTFNSSIVALKNEKFNILPILSILSQRLEAINTMLPKHEIISIPFKLLNINHAEEYPEENLNISTGVKQKPNVKEKGTAVPESQCFKEWCKLQDVSRKLSAVQANNQVLTDKQHTILLMEQRELICEILSSVFTWEKNLQNKASEREILMINSQILKLHLLYLNRKQLVLNFYEASEMFKSENIKKIQIMLKGLHEEETNFEKEILFHKSIIKSLNDQKRELLNQLHGAIGNNRFESFFKQVYKEKGKQSQDAREGSSASSTCSNASMVEDEKNSIEGNLAENLIKRNSRLSSNACPPGCDPQIYEQVINLREKRHELENKIFERECEIHIIENSLKIKQNETSVCQNELKEQQNSLKSVMKSKQNDLNNIECVIILTPSQCTSNALKEMQNGNDALIFSAKTMKSLQKRVDDLYQETEEQKAKFNMSQEHLKRMQADCDYMKNMITNLQNSIQKAITHKLGLVPPDINSSKNEIVKKEAMKLLDAVLESMMYQFKFNIASGTTKDMENQLRTWKQKQYDLEHQYCKALQEYTKRLQAAAILQAELSSYKTDEKRNKHYEFSRDGSEYQNDLMRLRDTKRKQQKQIEDLRAEIQRLKLKPYTIPQLPPITLTNVSITPSIAVSPLISDLAAASDNTSKLVVTALANKLVDVNGEFLSNEKLRNNLLDSLARIFPSILEGNMNIKEATDQLFNAYFMTEKSPCPPDSASSAKIRDIISDYLSQITNEMVALGEQSPKVHSDLENLQASHSEMKHIILELMEAGVSPHEEGVIDIAVAALLEIAPHLFYEKFDIDSIVKSIQDESDHSAEDIKKMTTALIGCFQTQLTSPEEAARVTMECLTELQHRLLNIRK